MLFVTFTGKKEMATFAPLDFLLALRKKIENETTDLRND